MKEQINFCKLRKACLKTMYNLEISIQSNDVNESNDCVNELYKRLIDGHGYRECNATSCYKTSDADGTPGFAFRFKSLSDLDVAYDNILNNPLFKEFTSCKFSICPYSVWSMDEETHNVSYKNESGIWVENETWNNAIEKIKLESYL